MVLLYATAWYNEAINARRRYVVRDRTIQWILDRLAYRPIERETELVLTDVLFPAVVTLMDAALDAACTAQQLYVNKIRMKARFQ